MKSLIENNSIIIKGITVALLVLLLDQASKYYLLEIVNLPAINSIEVLPFFNIVMVWNRGISFGMFSNFAYGQLFFSFLAILIVLFLSIWLIQTRKTWQAIAIGLLIGGATGNIIDRLRFSSVVDFLDFHLGIHHWPAFNIADSAITIGAIAVAFGGIFDNKERTNKIRS